jgi:hypothetical protein
MSEDIRIGRHVLRFEQDDLLLMEFHGDILKGEMGAMYRLHDERLVEEGRLFVLADVRDAAGMASTAKHEARDRPKPLPPHVVAVVGAPYTLRVMIDLLARATRLLTGGATTLRFFGTMDEARAYLHECRRTWKPSTPAGA